MLLLLLQRLLKSFPENEKWQILWSFISCFVWTVLKFKILAELQTVTCSCCKLGRFLGSIGPFSSTTFLLIGIIKLEILCNWTVCFCFRDYQGWCCLCMVALFNTVQCGSFKGEKKSNRIIPDRAAFVNHSCLFLLYFGFLLIFELEGICQNVFVNEAHSKFCALFKFEEKVYGDGIRMVD